MRGAMTVHGWWARRQATRATRHGAIATLCRLPEQLQRAKDRVFSVWHVNPSACAYARQTSHAFTGSQTISPMRIIIKAPVFGATDTQP